MDRKSFIVLLLCAALFALWVVLTPRLYPPPPPGSRATNAATAARTNAPGSNAVAPAAAAPALTPAPVPAGALPTNLLVSVLPPPGTAEHSIVLSNGATHYTFTSHGGGLKLVEFDGRRYPETVPSLSGKPLTNRPAALNRLGPQPILALAGASAVEGDGVYQLTRTVRTNVTPRATNVIEGVRAEKLLAGQVHLLKEFEVASDSLVTARVRIENRGTQALVLPPLPWSAGAAEPENLRDDGALVGFNWRGPDGSAAVDIHHYEPKTLGCFPGPPRGEYHATNIAASWVAARNQFFFQAVIPSEPAVEVYAPRVPLPPPSAAARIADRRVLTNQSIYPVTFVLPGTNLAPGAVRELNFSILATPKESRTLEAIGAKFQNKLDSDMGYGGFFGFFSRALLLAMNLLHSAGFSYALAIITITILIKLLFWPLTQAQMRSMKRMQELAPQMKAIQDRYKGEPEKLQRKLMEFNREHKINPLSGCLPMLVQIPVFIGFFNMVRSAIELRGATFLWALDLSKPDTVAILSWLNFLPWPLTWLHDFPVNPLSIIMGVTMWMQTRLTPMSPGMDPSAQKMMRYMPLFFLVILYNYSAGLTLYWTVQNLLSVLQTKLIKAREAREAQNGPAAAGTANAAPAASPNRPATPAARKRK